MRALAVHPATESGVWLGVDALRRAGLHRGMVFVSNRSAAVEALREVARLTSSGGRVVLILIGSGAGIEPVPFLRCAIAAVGPHLEHEPPRARPFEVTARMVAAGLRQIRIEELSARTTFRSASELYERVVRCDPSTSMLLDRLTAAQREEVRLVLEGMFRERGAGEPVTFETRVQIAIGIKP